MRSRTRWTLGAAAIHKAAVRAVVLIIAASAALAGCSSSVVTGTPVSIYDNPFTVAGLPITTGPSGPRPRVPASTLPVQNSDNTEADVLATNAIDDIQAYWATTYPTLFKGTFTPVTKLISWDAAAREGTGIRFCGDRTGGLDNAAYCIDDQSLGWDRTILLPALMDAFGPMSVVMVMAHEYGHAIQDQSGSIGDDDPTIVAEQQADCYGGAFIRTVAEGHSKHFTINTSDGLNAVLAATVSVRDTDPGDPDSQHGSAFERVTAVQIGFTDGAQACTKINEAEIDSRRADLPQQFEGADTTGELPITQDSLEAFSRSFESVMAVPDPPAVTYAGADIPCSDATATEPVSYCPATNTIGVDIPRLAERGTAAPASDNEVIPLNVTGDYSAYVLLASRYTLAVQKSQNLALSEPRTALRAACLSGAITASLSTANEQGADPGAPAPEIVLSPGDLDEAISGLLTDGLVASDVDGVTLPSGFSRVDAFRSGVLGGKEVCGTRYR